MGISCTKCKKSMFKTVQHPSQKQRNSSEKRISGGWHNIGHKTRHMKRGMNYKALTMVLGILVALLVAFTLWARTPDEGTSRARLTLPRPVLPTTKSVIRTAIDIILIKN
jgi:hypothetical protein